MVFIKPYLANQKKMFFDELTDSRNKLNLNMVKPKDPTDITYMALVSSAKYMPNLAEKLVKLAIKYDLEMYVNNFQIGSDSNVNIDKVVINYVFGSNCNSSISKSLLKEKSSIGFEFNQYKYIDFEITTTDHIHKN